MSTIKEYEYRPPNVRAVKWDGREDTAKAILEAAPLNAPFSVVVRRMSTAKWNGTSPVVSLFFGTDNNQFAVHLGDYVVFEPDGSVHLTEAEAFEYSYRATPPRPSIYAPSDNSTRPVTAGEWKSHDVPVTLEDEDYDTDNQLRNSQ